MWLVAVPHQRGGTVLALADKRNACLRSQAQ
ncbi:hypothetical protein JOF56_005688 [Kibdelosporangium banguiense]|uniref:Uncharacterized protein n=1 Tax=Kibdelosporangium banguiense TaxID=1365924 RepID=A0ABS4TLL2_9PSEU|nr:hypothetical protein [Kibdelosporangium banguiense]